MSPTGQISPAIRFDLGVSFRARGLQQGPFRANVLVCLRAIYPRTQDRDLSRRGFKKSDREPPATSVTARAILHSTGRVVNCCNSAP
jgi:hypothetical protein